MKIEISSKNIELLPSLNAYIEEKIGMLQKHVQKFESEGETSVRVRIGRTSEHHHKGEIFEVSADLALPGTSLHADKTDADLHTAVDLVRDALAYEAEKYKDKHSPS